MSSKPETVFRARVVKDLKTLNNVAIFSIQQKTIKGDPDLMLCVMGYFVGLEIKSKEGAPTALQKVKLEQIVAAGGYAYVVYPDNWKDIFSLVKFLSEGRKVDEHH